MPEPPAPPASPAGDPPAPGGLDEAKLTELIGNVVSAELDRRTTTPPAPAAPAPPVAPPAPLAGAPADLAAAVNAAVENALRARDEGDRLAIMEEAIEKLTKLATGPRKRSWGSFFVGI